MWNGIARSVDHCGRRRTILRYDWRGRWMGCLQDPTVENLTGQPKTESHWYRGC